MKKILAVILIATVLVGLLVGCGAGGTVSNREQDYSKDEQVLYPDTEATENNMENDLFDDDFFDNTVDDHSQENELVEISTPKELANIEDNPNGSYILTNDIDLSQIANWDPLCSSGSPFTGTLDGNGYCIKNINVDMKYDEDVDDSEYAGLFCCVSGATIQNLGIVGGTVRISSLSNHGVAGALAGSSEIRKNGYDQETLLPILAITEVRNCWVSATVESHVPEDGASYATMAIGAFFGEGCANFTNSYNVGKLAAAKKYADQIMGGFIGAPHTYSQFPMTIKSCYNVAMMTGLNIKGDTPGGFVGYALGKEDVEIIDSYYGTDANALNKVRKAMTDNKDTVFKSVKGLKIADLKVQSNFIGFDFDKVWGISPDINDGYPYLKIQKSVVSDK